MKHMETVPFSALIAGMLLCNKKISSANIVNTISDLSNHNIYIDDEDDDLRDLFSCISVDSNYTGFCLRDDLDYNSILYNNITVYDFLVSQSKNSILSYLGVHLPERTDVIINDNNRFVKKRIFDIKSMVLRRTKGKIAV